MQTSMSVASRFGGIVRGTVAGLSVENFMDVFRIINIIIESVFVTSIRFRNHQRRRKKQHSIIRYTSVAVRRLAAWSAASADGGKPGGLLVQAPASQLGQSFGRPASSVLRAIQQACYRNPSYWQRSIAIIFTVTFLLYRTTCHGEWDCVDLVIGWSADRGVSMSVYPSRRRKSRHEPR